MRSGFEAFRDMLIHRPVELIQPLIIFAITFVAGWLVRRLIFRALDAYNKRTESRSGRILRQALRGPTMIWILILALHLATQGSDLSARITSPLANVLLVLWIVSLTVMSLRVVGNIVHYYGAQIPGAMPVTTLTETLAKIAVMILGGLILLNHFNVPITPILSALGIGGLAVALALQDTLSNLFGGFYVAVAGQIRLGDYVKVNTGTPSDEGYVMDIGWRCTSLRAQTNSLIIVPNAKLAQAVVTNYNLPEKRLGTKVVVTVSYESDPDRVEAVLLEVLQKAVGEVPHLLAEPAPWLAFEPGFVDSGIGLTANFNVEDFPSQAAVSNELRKRIFRRLREEGIEMPYPTRTVFLRGSRKRTPGHT